MNKSDDVLMDLYSRGDEEAFKELYGRYKNKIYGYLFKKVGSEVRDEIFQEVFMKLHQKKHLYSSDSPFAPWFFTLAKNTVVDFYRKKKLNTSQLCFEPLAPSIEMEDGDGAVDLPKLNINKDDEKLLYLKFVEGHAYKELEEEFKSTASSLRKRVSRLIKSIN